MTQEELDRLIQSRGGLASTPYVIDAQIDNPNDYERAVHPKVDNPNPRKKYIFKDGTWIDLRNDDATAGAFQVTDSGTGLKPPTQSTSAPSHTPIKTHNPDGTTTITQWAWDPANQRWAPDPTLPVETEPAPAGSKPVPPSDPSKWQPIYAVPGDPTSKVIALQDPANSSNRVTVPQGATPDRPQLSWGPDKAPYSWDGSKLTKLGDATESSRQIIQGPNGRVQVFDGKKIETLEEGSNPKAGDHYDTIENVNGKSTYVTKTYQGNGTWSTQNTGKSADPNAPVEGNKRYPIQNGMRTTQTYQGGEWVTTDVGDKVKPDKPTQLTASTTAPYEQYMDDKGNITTRENVNFMPKTLADVQARRGQIQKIMADKSAEIQAKVAADPKAYTPQQGLDDYNKWYDQNVASQIQMIQAAQDQAIQDNARQMITSRTGAQTAATAAGAEARQAADAWAKMNPISDPAAFAKAADALAHGKMPDISAAAMDVPNPVDQSRNAALEALKYIDPTAARLTGTPPPDLKPTDFAQSLAQYRYGGNGSAPPPAPGGQGGFNPNDIQWNQPSNPADVAGRTMGPGGIITGGTADAFANTGEFPGWQRADQAQGAAPPGDELAAAGVAGAVAPGSPQFLGTYANQVADTELPTPTASAPAITLDALRRRSALIARGGNPWDMSTYVPFR